MEDAEVRLYRQGYQVWSEWIWNSGNPKHLGHEFTGYRYWRDEWRGRGINSPLDLVTKDRPNHRSIGIEIQSPPDELRTAQIFTDEQYNVLSELVSDVCKRNRIPVRREFVLGHQDVTPLRRCNARGGYDPGVNFSFNRLWDAIC